MEPDTINPNEVTLPYEARSNRHSTAQNIPPSMIINSFSAAMNVLKQHTFRNVVDFESAANMAAELYARTYEVVTKADISNLQAAHSTLSPSDDFLAYMSTLHASLASIEHDSPHVPILLTAFRNVVHQSDASWAIAVAERWVGTARHAVRLAIETPGSLCALSLGQTLRVASDKLCSETDELVPIHADFLALCLHAKYYRVAANWIRRQRRFYVDPFRSKLQATDVHLIYHYSTLVLIGIKDYRGALQTCRLAFAVSAPSPGIFFTVATQTYRLYILLHAFVTGKAPTTLKFMSYQGGSMRKVASEYIELACAYEKHDMEKMRQLIESNRESFAKHGHLGIVKQLLDSFLKRLVSRLSDCYVTMTLGEIAEKVGLNSEEDAHRLLLEMIESNQLSALIDERSKVVQLIDRDARDEEHLTTQMSSSSMTHCLEIISRLQRFREDVECDPEYVKKGLAGHNQRKQNPSNPGLFATASTGVSLGVTEIEAESLR